MIKLDTNFVIDQDGNKIGVFLNINAYKKIIEELEELDEIRAYDAAKASKDEEVLFDQVVNEIEKKDHQ